MAVLLQLLDAHKSYGHQVLLDGAEVTLTDAHKVGFIGRNGAGKSTLCRVLLGDEELDKGEVVRHPKLRLGYLRQHDPFLPGETVLEFLMRDSGQPDWQCGEVAGRFEMKGAYLEGPMQKLSGGWQTRVKLAALLLHDPNLLLLDEPTNFLDLRTQILLEHFLRDFRQACLIVSHDRAFLGATCSQTLELSRGKLTLFPGPIDAFLEYQRERREHDERVNAAMLAKRRHLETFIDKNRARASTASRARSKGKQLEKLRRDRTGRPRSRRFRIRTPVGRAAQGAGAALSRPGDRISRLRSGQRNRRRDRTRHAGGDRGRQRPGQDDVSAHRRLFAAAVGRSDALGLRLRDRRLCPARLHQPARKADRAGILGILGRAGHQNASHSGSGRQLSVSRRAREQADLGAQRRRAGPAVPGRAAAQQYNVLVLDEPGNHLDVDTVDALAEALNDYKGTVLFTSHDRHFMKRVATAVVEVRAGRVVNYRGDYDAYLYYVNKEIEEGEREQAARQSPGKSRPPAPRMDRKQQAQQQRELRKEVTALERNIARLDQRKRDLNAQLLEATDPAEALRLHKEVTAIAQELTPIEERWCELQELVEADEA